LNDARLGPADFAAALGVVIIWGLNFVAMKLALRDFTPFQLGVARYVFAVVPLIFLVARPRLPWWWMLAGGLGQLGHFAFLFLALRDGMTAAMASVLMQTQLFFTTLLGVFLLGERLKSPGGYSLALAAAGLACFALSALQGSAGGDFTVAGLSLNLAAAFMWAVSNIIARRAQQSHPDFDALQYVVWMSLVPTLPFMLLSWQFDPPDSRWRWLEAGAVSWAAVAYLGWLATIAAYAMWTWLLKRHAASRVSPFSLGTPVVGLAAGMWLLDESVGLLQWIGSGLVIAALVLVMAWDRVRQARAPRS